MSLSRIIYHSHLFTRLEIYHHIYFIIQNVGNIIYDNIVVDQLNYPIQRMVVIELTSDCIGCLWPVHLCSDSRNCPIKKNNNNNDKYIDAPIID